jgi:hypothetical protein
VRHVPEQMHESATLEAAPGSSSTTRICTEPSTYVHDCLDRPRTDAGTSRWHPRLCWRETHREGLAISLPVRAPACRAKDC